MPFQKWTDSLNNAIEGVLQAAKTERHLRYHLYAAAAVVLFSYAVGVTKTEFLIIALITLFVIMAELINTAIETTVDLLSPQHSEQARIAKDVAAGAVLTTALGAAVIGYIVLFPYLVHLFRHGVSIARHAKNEIAVLAFIIVTILVVLIKALVGKGRPIRGGMPSGHAAISFSIWVSITFISRNFTASLLSLVAAVMIARSRVTVNVHSGMEVLAGALLGAAVTLVLFMIFV